MRLRYVPPLAIGGRRWMVMTQKKGKKKGKKPKTPKEKE